MSYTRNMARSFAAAAAGLALAAPLAAAPAAQADPIIDMAWEVNASTTIKKLNKKVELPTGTLTAKIDLATQTLVGDLDIPGTTTTLDLGKLPLANVSIEMNQRAPVTGTFDFPTAYADTTATFDVQILAIRPVLLPWLNLVSGSCTTERPATARLAGTMALGGVTDLKTSYTLPKFKNCGLLTTPIINLAMSGEGNGLDVSLE